MGARMAVRPGKRGKEFVMDLTRRNFVKVCGLGLAGAGTVALVGCGGEEQPADDTQSDSTGDASTAKPVIFYNRQPSNSTTGELDMTTLNFNENTYYVGFDATQGGDLQGEMVLEYIKAHAAELDRNGDGIIGYVLAIGDIGHNDSIARTRGVRRALGTGIEQDGNILSDPAGVNTDGSATVVQDATLDVDGTTYTIRELASAEMKNQTGATWDAATAGNTLQSWTSSFGDQIDVVVSNNDGMGMSMYNAWSAAEGVPTFGYDANSDAVAAIADGYAGTISQNPAVQAYLTLRLIRNILDGVDIDTGIGTADEAGNVIAAEDFTYNADQRSYYAMNLAVTAENYESFLDATAVYETASTQLDEASSPNKRVWLNTYNAADNFLGSTYKPLLEKYDDLLNLTVDYVDGDGQSESSVTNRLGNPDEYDAFAINMIKTDNGASYTQMLG